MKKLSVVFLCGVAFVAAAPALAQGAEEAGADGEIVVTAQKRAQSVRDIGINITAFGEEELRRSQATDVAALASQLTNVVATTSVNLPAFTVRGIGLNEFASNFDSPVAIHVDEVYKSKPYMATIPFFDIQRVEALKGPQGTLFGRNTTGGSVNYYTAEPQFGTAAAMNFNFDNHGRGRIDGFVNGALSDSVAVRASYLVAQGSGGPYRNLLTGDDHGEPNQIVGRLQLKWQGPSTSLRLMGYAFRDKSELTPYKSPGIFNPDGTLCPQVFTGEIRTNRAACLKYGPFVPGPNPLGLRETQSIRELSADNPQGANNTAYGGYARLEHQTGGVTLTSITAFDYFERDQTDDPDNSPYITANQNYYDRINQFSQELRLFAKLGRLNLLVGGFYEHDSIVDATSANLLQNALIGLPPFAPRLAAAFKQKVRSLAGFTNAEYQLTDTITLIGGLRYTSDRTSIDALTYIGADDPTGRSHIVTPVIPADALVDRRTDNTTSFRAGINWKPSSNQLVYASISRGFRSGGYSIPFGGVITTFDPERLTAYEIGSKSRLFDRKLDLNLSAFFYDYKDLQTNVDDPTSPLVPITRNIGGSRTYGVEADVTFRPEPSFLVKLGGSYLDARFRNTNAIVTTYVGPVPLNGKRPVNNPKWSGQGMVQKSFDLGSGLELIGSTDARYVGKRFLEATGQIFDRAPAYWVQNARLTLASKEGGWEIAAWGKNIWNKEYLTYINNVSFFRLEIYGEPVSYGLSASVKF
ncbi:TonB-dependent receptor [Sphingomonadaceae bacterium G21617-S1]|nr:TonB-dependent receptor [Sphingomonadaceae bacterium G21617-S1]